MCFVKYEWEECNASHWIAQESEIPHWEQKRKKRRNKYHFLFSMFWCSSCALICLFAKFIVRFKMNTWFVTFLFRLLNFLSLHSQFTIKSSFLAIIFSFFSVCFLELKWKLEVSTIRTSIDFLWVFFFLAIDVVKFESLVQS